MADIFHDFQINAPKERVFHAVSTPEGLDSWWTKLSSGRPELGSEYQLWFGPEYDWRAVVSKYVSNVEFELELTKSMNDWQATHVGFVLKEQDSVTQVRFYHTGWPEPNDHYRGSSYCWAVYLRLLKRFVEHDEVVAYDHRYDA